MNYMVRQGVQAAKEFMAAFHPDREWWIVGGMLRDNDYGRPFKDIDIFINGYDTDLLPEGEVDMGDKNAYLLRAYTVEAYPYKGDTFEINLIFMRGDFWTLESMTDRCDFGICQIGYCPVQDETYRSPSYLADLLQDALTLTRNTTKERCNRMQSKFPRNVLRNPDGFKLDDKKYWSYNSDTGRLDIKWTQTEATALLT